MYLRLSGGWLTLISLSILDKSCGVVSLLSFVGNRPPKYKHNLPASG